MFHEQKAINGILHHRESLPSGEWIPYTLEQLTCELAEERSYSARLEQIIKYLEAMIKAVQKALV